MHSEREREMGGGYEKKKKKGSIKIENEASAGKRD
jgi:hypothetical protein